MAADFRPVAPVDPTNLRPMLFLDVAREMMLAGDWSHPAVSVVMESHTGPFWSSRAIPRCPATTEAMCGAESGGSSGSSGVSLPDLPWCGTMGT